GEPDAGRVLVVPALERGHRLGDHLGRPVDVGEALAQVDRAGADGERRHLREDRRRDSLESRGEHPTTLPLVPTTDDSLAADIDATCRLTGEFTLRSGQVSNEYFDKYLFEADPLLLARVAREMIQLVPHDTDLL